jgi:hypothetical protein
MPDPVKPDDRGALENTDQIADEVFDTAFNEASEGTGQPDISASDDPKNVQETPTPPVVQPADKEVQAVAPVETPTEQSTEPPPPPPEDFKQQYLTLQGIHKHDRENFKTRESELLAQLDELKAKVSVVPPTPKVDKTDPISIADLYDSLSDEDKASLKEYDEEFDIVSKMEGKKRDVAFQKLRKEYETGLQAIKEELKAEFATQFTPTATFIKEAQEKEEIRTQEAHFSAIRNAHPDFENYRDDGSILKWVESKPSYLRKGALETYSQGSVEEIVELLSDFKRENNLSTSQPPNNVVPINPAKEAKRQAMTTVTTRRGAVNASMTVANDFEGAFDEAMNKHGG